VPLISVIVGEGGSGGAIALASGHSIMMLTYSIFSIISPDGCAAILWKDRAYAPNAAEALKITSKDLLKLGIIDKEITEPYGGAHRFPQQAIENTRQALKKELKRLMDISPDMLRVLQQNKFGKL
jgi:acetyl-CoA carboxylase carboxyl transferase subunit alpha